MEEGSRKTKDKRFIVELIYRSINRILKLYVKIECKSSAFGVRGSSGEERRSFLSLSYGQVVELRPRSNWLTIVIRCYKENKLSYSTHHFD